MIFAFGLYTILNDTDQMEFVNECWFLLIAEFSFNEHEKHVIAFVIFKIHCIFFFSIHMTWLKTEIIPLSWSVREDIKLNINKVQNHEFTQVFYMYITYRYRVLVQNATEYPRQPCMYVRNSVGGKVKLKVILGSCMLTQSPFDIGNLVMKHVYMYLCQKHK